MNYIHKSLDEKKEECISLLQSIDRTDIDKLIAHITKMGYFIAPGSKGHHRFIGGLVSHSLETYHKAMEIRQELIEKGVDAAFMPRVSSLPPLCMTSAKQMHLDSTNRHIKSMMRRIRVGIVHDQ